MVLAVLLEAMEETTDNPLVARLMDETNHRCCTEPMDNLSDLWILVMPRPAPIPLLLPTLLMHTPTGLLRHHTRVVLLNMKVVVKRLHRKKVSVESVPLQMMTLTTRTLIPLSLPTPIPVLARMTLVTMAMAMDMITQTLLT
jgi:hypothetical protein